MKALILSAGLGTRLLPLTTLLPKPLIPICNIPLLDIVIDRLKGCGYTSFGINLHHLPHRIMDHCAERRGDRFYFSHEPEILGTGGGIAGFASFLSGEESFLVHNGDIISTADMKGALAYHRDQHAYATLILVDHGPTNSITILPDGTVRDIWGKLGRTEPGRTLTFSGIALYDGSIMADLPQGSCYSIIDILLKRLAEGHRDIRGYVQEQCYWNDIGHLGSYIDLHRHILQDRLLMPPGMADPVRTFLYGEGVSIGEKAEISGFAALGKGAVVGPGARLKNCIIWPGTMVPPETEKENTIFADNLVVEVA